MYEARLGVSVYLWEGVCISSEGCLYNKGGCLCIITLEKKGSGGLGSHSKERPKP
jgi:hypothetical protein